MKVLTMIVELKYDAESMHGGDSDTDGKDWFFHEILKRRLILFSDEIKDEIGEIKILEVI